jgi:hypothetical protein
MRMKLAHLLCTISGSPLPTWSTPDLSEGGEQQRNLTFATPYIELDSI